MLALILLMAFFVPAQTFGDGATTITMTTTSTITVTTVVTITQGTQTIVTTTTTNPVCVFEFSGTSDDIKEFRMMALDFLLALSPDMQAKVADACAHNGNKLNFAVGRNVKDNKGNVVLFGRYVPSVNTVYLNLADFDINTLKQYMSNPLAGDQKVELAMHFLMYVLAHEIDHARGPGHKDPATKDAAANGVGPPDEDANTVMKQIGIPIQRINYVGPDLTIRFLVQGYVIILRAGDIKQAQSQVQQPAGSTGEKFIVDPTTVKSVPGTPCSGQTRSATCYVPVSSSGIVSTTTTTPIPYTTRSVVGGTLVPIDRLDVLAPYIGLASLVVVATAAAAIYAGRAKRREKQ